MRQTLYVHVTYKDMPPAVFSCMPVRATPELTLAHVQRLAQKRGIEAQYALATEKEYWDYRNRRYDQS